LPYRTVENRIEGVVINFADITQLKQAAEKHRLLATVLLDSNDAVTVHDFEGKITTWNSGAERMYGYSEAEALAMNLDQLVPRERRAEVRAMIEQLRQDKSVDSWETQRVCKDGRVLDVWLTVTTLKNEQGIPMAVATTERDITDRNRYHTELERMVLDRTAQLEAANKELGQDITVRKDLEREILEIAAAEERRIGQDLHDGMGQELTGLSLMAQNLVDTHNSFPGAEIAAKIAEGLQRALKQVRSLSKGLIPVEVDAEGLMAALEDLATRINELKGITCTFECAAPVLIENNSKATHLYRIAQEAVTNSLKHSQAPNIKICLEGTDQLVTLKIQDDGVGIQESLADSKGMGLKIMAYRAELLNANLTFQSVKNQGTEVTCTLGKGQLP
jgi:PAS domain S-box-containing protein